MSIHRCLPIIEFMPMGAQLHAFGLISALLVKNYPVTGENAETFGKNEGGKICLGRQFIITHRI